MKLDRGEGQGERAGEKQWTEKLSEGPKQNTESRTRYQANQIQKAQWLSAGLASKIALARKRAHTVLHCPAPCRTVPQHTGL